MDPQTLAAAMLLFNGGADRSLIDRISTTLQLKIAGLPSPAHTNTFSPTPSATSSESPTRPKRPGSPLVCDTACKKTLFVSDLLSPVPGTPTVNNLLLPASAIEVTPPSSTAQTPTPTKKEKTPREPKQELLSPTLDDGEYSDSDSSEQGTNDDSGSGECISPQDYNPGAPADPEAVFCCVPGRLSLLSSTSKYKVTVGELQRRLSIPESLNASILGGILRRAKSKNGGKSLRDSLEKIGLNLPAGRRKAASVTLLTSLVEGEAEHLARDFHQVVENDFPVREMAALTSAKWLSESEMEKEKRREQLRATKSLLHEFLALIDRDPILDTIDKGNEESAIESVKAGLNIFNLTTHGFGHRAVATGLSCFMKFCDDSLNQLNTPTSNNTALATVTSLIENNPSLLSMINKEVFAAAAAAVAAGAVQASPVPM